MSMSEAESRLRQLYIDTALEYVGTQQGDRQHKEIIKLYNTIEPLRFGYPMNTSLAWCAAFVCAMAQKCGITGVCFTSRGCTDLVNQYRAARRWKSVNSSYDPQPGDWIIYAKAGESGYNHVGIFISKDDKGNITTVEGNIGNSSFYGSSVQKLPSGKKYRDRDGKYPFNEYAQDFHTGYYIAGYCRPDFASLAPYMQPVSKPYTRVFYKNKWWKATAHMYTDNKWCLCRDWTHTNGTWYTSGEVELKEPPAAEIIDVSKTYSKDAPLSENQMKVNARYLWQVFQGRGWTLNAVCGMLGNMQVDSTINPGAGQNYGGSGYGLVQWNPASEYLNWCSNKGLDPSHMDSAIARIQWEYDKGAQYNKTVSYPLTFKEFSKSTATPEYLAEVFMNNYKGPDARNLEDRIEAARAWYDYLSVTIYLPTT